MKLLLALICISLTSCAGTDLVLKTKWFNVETDGSKAVITPLQPIVVEK